MTDIQQKLLTLLTDLDAVCKREGIRYYLCKETALSAHRSGEFFPSCCEANVAMTAEDALRFIKAVNKEGRADRMVDSMYSNKNYPDFTLRYGDTGTLMMQLPYNEASVVPCVAVTVHMIRYKSKYSSKIYHYTKSLWKLCVKPTVTVAGFTRRAVMTACHGLRNVLGGKYFSRALFKLWVSIHSKKNKKNISICAGSYKYENDLIKSRSTLTLEDGTFTTFADVEGYLLTAYGENYETCKPKYLKPSSSLLVSSHVSYREYLRRSKEQIDYKEIQKKKMKLDLIQAKVSYYNSKINGYYAIVDRTQRRYAMHQMYMPMKDKLIELHRTEQWEELNELLKPYRSALWACYKKKLGLCFDKEIFEMTMDILLMEGSKSYVRKLRAMVPESHWEPMVITDYKGEPIEYVG